MRDRGIGGTAEGANRYAICIGNSTRPGLANPLHPRVVEFLVALPAPGVNLYFALRAGQLVFCRRSVVG